MMGIPSANETTIEMATVSNVSSSLSSDTGSASAYDSGLTNNMRMVTRTRTLVESTNETIRALRENTSALDAATIPNTECARTTIWSTPTLNQFSGFRRYLLLFFRRDRAPNNSNHRPTPAPMYSANAPDDAAPDDGSTSASTLDVFGATLRGGGGGGGGGGRGT